MNSLLIKADYLSPQVSNWKNEADFIYNLAGEMGHTQLPEIQIDKSPVRGHYKHGEKD